MCGILAVLQTRTLDEQALRQRLLQLSRRLRHRGPDWNGVCVQRIGVANGTQASAVHPTEGAAAAATGLGSEELSGLSSGAGDAAVGVKRARLMDAAVVSAGAGPVGQLVSVLCHERLSIVDPAGGAQPLYSEDGQVALSVNGEIFNHKRLRELLQARVGHPVRYKTQSDCEPIVHMFRHYKPEEFLPLLDGYFALILSDTESGEFLIARDPIGVNSLYIGYGADGSIWAASEMKAIQDECDRFEEFPPGSFFSSRYMEHRRWYLPPWWDERLIPVQRLDLRLLRETFERAVVKRLMSDVPYGVLLSGGLDSSLVASIANRHAGKRVEENERTAAWWPRLHSFSIGLVGSPDLKAARVVADFLGTVHHEINFTVQEGIDAIPDVIYHLETYDVTSIRASTPMYFLSRVIKAMGVKMVLSGEGSDEIFGGYLYFHKAPSKEKFHTETVQKLKMLSKYDCLRANKSTLAWGVEVRVPFLDKEFLDVAMQIDPQEKMIDKRKGRMEKYILRKAFDEDQTGTPYLPSSILWRQKEQFSDGVGYSWIDGLKAHANLTVTDQQLATAKYRFPHNPPLTKEAYWYRHIFTKHFPKEAAAATVPGGPSVACSTPAAIEWEKSWASNADPSGRAVKDVHESTA